MSDLHRPFQFPPKTNPTHEILRRISTRGHFYRVCKAVFSALMLAHLIPSRLTLHRGPLRRERAEADMDKFRERSEQAADRARAREETATAHLEERERTYATRWQEADLRCVGQRRANPDSSGHVARRIFPLCANKLTLSDWLVRIRIETLKYMWARSVSSALLSHLAIRLPAFEYSLGPLNPRPPRRADAAENRAVKAEHTIAEMTEDARRAEVTRAQMAVDAAALSGERDQLQARGGVFLTV